MRCRVSTMMWSSLRVMGVVLAVAAMVNGGRLEARAYSAPSCDASQDWSWTDNKQHKNPCLTAAYLQGACGSTEFQITPLPPGQKYDPPSQQFVNPCSCSWAMYNLYSACTRCQGEQNGIVSWASWHENCGGDASTTEPFPSNYTIPDNTTFPLWAATDPTTWPDARWDLLKARDVANTHPGDWSGSRSPTATSKPKTGSNIGAIAGGVVGGVLALAIGVAIALFLFCRNKRKAQKDVLSQTTMAQSTLDQHVRSPSDISAKTYGPGFGYTPLPHTSSPSMGSVSRIPHSPTTFHTHNSSRASFTHESLLTSVGYPVTPPPQGMQTPPNVYMTAHGTVSPFTLDRPSSSQDTPTSHDRKRAENVTHGNTGSSSSTAVQPRSPMNPPAYSEASQHHGDFSSQAPDQVSTYGSTSIVTTPQSALPRHPHEKSPSVGSMGSQVSNSSGTSIGYWTHTNSASLSGAAGLLSQMDSGSLPGPSTTVPPGYIGPGPGATTQYRDEKRRPTVMNQASGDGDNNNPSNQQ